MKHNMAAAKYANDMDLVSQWTVARIYTVSLL